MSQPAQATQETGPDGHRYNDDLLLEDAPRQVAASKHREVFPVLDHPELRESFRGINTRANSEKRMARSLGFWAVLAALLSLILGASEPLWEHEWHWPHLMTVGIGVLAALLGLAAALVAAFRMMHGQRKYEWLRARLRTERLRQFHFQTFLFRLPDILAVVAARRAAGPNTPAEQAYTAARQGWRAEYEALDGAWATQDPKELIEEVVRNDKDVSPPVWLHGLWADGPPVAEPTFPAASATNKTDLDAVFKAYDAFRFHEQVGYADYNLREKNASAGPARKVPLLERFPGRTLPHRQWRKILKSVLRPAFASMVLLHVLLLILLLVPMPFDVKPFVLPLGVAIMWAALVAVAVRTLMEGFALTREIERNEEYLAVCADLRRRFWATSSADEKFRLMVQMERASFEEMREFMRSHLEASFVL